MGLTQDKLDYMVSFIEGENRKDWNEAINKLGEDIHPDSLRKAFNVSDFSGYSVYQFMREQMENDFMSDSEVARLEELRDREFKERVKLQDANREKRKVLRDFSRMEALQEYIQDRLEFREPIEFTLCDYKISNGNEASILVSDMHCGATIDSVFNYYDIDVLKERMIELANKTIAFAQKDKVETIYAEFLGDSITGIIHGSTIAQAQEDVIEQIFIVSDIITDFLIRLREEIPNVKAYITFGNHGRVQANKTAGANKENFERLIAPYVSKELRDTDISIFNGGYEDFITYRLKDGGLIVVTHGTRDNPLNAKSNFTQMLGEQVHEVHMGHYHEYKEGNGVVVNGSVMGSDDYAISIRKNGNAKQIMKVYYNDGDVATYQLSLS